MIPMDELGCWESSPVLASFSGAGNHSNSARRAKRREWGNDPQPIGPIMVYMVTFTINIPPMLAYIPYMDPMGNHNYQ